VSARVGFAAVSFVDAPAQVAHIADGTGGKARPALAARGAGIALTAVAAVARVGLAAVCSLMDAYAVETHVAVRTGRQAGTALRAGGPRVPFAGVAAVVARVHLTPVRLAAVFSPGVRLPRVFDAGVRHRAADAVDADVSPWACRQSRSAGVSAVGCTCVFAFTPVAARERFFGRADIERQAAAGGKCAGSGNQQWAFHEAPFPFALRVREPVSRLRLNLTGALRPTR
jgi:hypothetical protein